MKKIIVFLIGCLLFVSCSSSNNKISEKSVITISELSNHISKYEKQNVYIGDCLIFYDSKIEFPKEVFDLKQSNIKLNKKQYFGEATIYPSEGLFENFYPETLSKIFKSKVKENYKPVIIFEDENTYDQKMKYIKDGIAKLIKNRGREVSYVVIKNNKVEEILYGYKDKGFNECSTLSFSEYKKLKKDFNGLSVNDDNVFVTTYFAYNNSVYKKTGIIYTFSKPIEFKNKKVLNLMVQYDLNNNNKELYGIFYDVGENWPEFMELK